MQRPDDMISTNFVNELRNNLSDIAATVSFINNQILFLFYNNHHNINNNNNNYYIRFLLVYLMLYY